MASVRTTKPASVVNAERRIMLKAVRQYLGVKNNQELKELLQSLLETVNELEK